MTLLQLCASNIRSGPDKVTLPTSELYCKVTLFFAKVTQSTALLHLAAEKGWIEAIEWCLDCGADIESRLSSGHTPLHIAAQAGQWDVCQVLTARGADVLAQTDSGDVAADISVAHHEQIPNCLGGAGWVQDAKEPDWRAAIIQLVNNMEDEDLRDAHSALQAIVTQRPHNVKERPARKLVFKLQRSRSRQVD